MGLKTKTQHTCARALYYINLVLVYDALMWFKHIPALRPPSQLTVYVVLHCCIIMLYTFEETVPMKGGVLGRFFPLALCIKRKTTKNLCTT